VNDSDTVTSVALPPPSLRGGRGAAAAPPGSRLGLGAGGAGSANATVGNASFCRGVGNACLADHRFDFIRVTSARSKDLTTKNIIIPHVGGVSTEPYSHLQCHGRSSFFLNADGTHDAATSEADKLHNRNYEM
jgi:hypothetical protein